jgi:F-type H+-transporting ATPase subunit alpha
MPTLLESTVRWAPRATAALAQLQLGAVTQTVGRVETVGDGVASISGLADVRLNELLRFDGGHFGYALNLEAERIGCVLLDTEARIEAGTQVHGTGEVVRVPVGSALLGRIIDPLGRPLDGAGTLTAERRDPVERAAPEIVDRDLVTQPVHTGVLAVDALFALGRGQRELLIGDRATGKTTLATDVLISQKNSDIVCVYVAVGQKSSSTARVIDAVKTYGAPQRTVFVVAGPADAPGLQWIAPFSGMTIAEYFRDRGEHALIVIDDLSKHAATHRELALLTHQPPGREAYPGDVFYVHARLLERAAKLAPEKGGGSLTALPIAETEAGNLSAYIPTNLVSITDGQIVFDTKLFNAGHKPAIDTGLSVSRVGGKTQARTLREAAGSLRLDYAQFLELEAFTRFGTAVDARVQAQIARGERIRAALSQPQYAPLTAAMEIALLLALQSGALDALPAMHIGAFRNSLTSWLQREGASLARAAAENGPLNQTIRDDTVAHLTALAASIAATATAQ